MRKNVVLFAVWGVVGALAFACSAADWDGAYVGGSTAEGKCFYATGETMTFRLQVGGLGELPAGEWKLRWTRTGDDGVTQTGEAPVSLSEPCEIRTSLDRPGFVRIQAAVVGAPEDIRFDGGAGVDFPHIAANRGEPADFDDFWRGQLAALGRVPANPVLTEVMSPKPGVKLYAYRLECTGGKPSTGYLSVPAAAGKYPARLFFYGYQQSWRPVVLAPPAAGELATDEIQLRVNTHGLELNREADYYAKARAAVSGGGQLHGWRPDENEKPETCYFLGMVLRGVRAAQYAQSLEKWNGCDLALCGGSQGAFQGVLVAALCPRVTFVDTFVNWLCDVRGKAQGGRLASEFQPAYRPGLDYFDEVFHARRIPSTCTVKIGHAALGDYVSPPTGIACLYNALVCRKSIRWVQNAEHTWQSREPGRATVDFAAAPRPPAFSFKYDGKEVRGGASMQVDARLKVTVERTDHPDFDATEWVLWFENPSAEKSGVLSDIRDGDFLVALPPAAPKFRGDVSVPGDRAVITMEGCKDGGAYSYDDFQSAQEFRARPRYFHPSGPKQHAVQNAGGRSSDGQAPFFEVTDRGQGAVVAFGWTGDWKASFENGTDGVRVTTGLRNARFYLEPGEKLRTGRVLVMNYAKGEDAGNKFRRLVRRHFSHLSHGGATREGIFANELWGGLTSDEMVKRLKSMQVRGITFEDIWIDAGWYGESKKCDDAYTGDWPAWTGDWTPNPRVHPDGLEAVRDAAKATGAGLMLWIEPERVVKTSKFAKTHPELLVDAGWSRLLHYGNPAARAYVADLVTDLAQRLNFSCYRQDFNMGLTEAFARHDKPDRRGITEIRHVMGLYEVWDRILARNPGLLIDNCSSGGRRLDIETLRRTVFFFRSDYQCGFNANADVVQAHNVGLSRLIPLGGCTTKLSDLYSLRSAYSASYGVAYWNTVFQREDAVDWVAAKKSHDEYLKIRRYFSRDFYNHGSVALDEGAWAIWQYHDPETNEGVVLAFRRAGSSCDRATVALKGLRKGCRVATENLDSGVTGECDGAISIELPKRRSSTVVLYHGH